MQWRGVVLFVTDPSQYATSLQLKLKADMSAGWAIVGTSARRRSRGARGCLRVRVGVRLAREQVYGGTPPHIPAVRARVRVSACVCAYELVYTCTSYRAGSSPA